MPGTLVSDSLAVVLSSANITSATTTTGTAFEISWPGNIQIEAVIGTQTGTHTEDIEVQASDSSTFASTNVSLGRFAQIANTATATQRLTAFCNKKYIRCVRITAGTVTASTITVTVRPVTFQRALTTSA